MPKYTPEADELDESYADAPAAPAEAAPGETETAEAETPGETDEASEMGDTALVSNKILSPDGKPLKAGDTVTLKVVKNFGDES